MDLGDESVVDAAEVQDQVARMTEVLAAASAVEAQGMRGAGGSVGCTSNTLTSTGKAATVETVSAPKSPKRKAPKPRADSRRATSDEEMADAPAHNASTIIAQLSKIEGVPKTDLLRSVYSLSTVGASALQLVAEGCIYKLIDCLKACTRTRKKVLAVKTIRNLCRLPDALNSLSDRTLHTRLVEMIQSEIVDEQLSAIQLAQDLCEDSEAHKLSLQWIGAIEPIIALARSEHSEIKRGAIWTTASCTSCEGPRNDIIAGHGVELVVDGTRDEDPSVSALSASALGRMACHQQSRIAVVDAGGISVLVKLLREGIEAQKGEALKALALIVLHQDLVVDPISMQLYSSGMLALAEYGSADVKSVAVNALQSLGIDHSSWSSIEADGSSLSHLSLLDRSNTQPKLTEILALNLLVRNPQHLKTMIDRRGIERVTTFLTAEDVNVRLVAIETLRDMLLAPIGTMSETKRAAIAALMGLLNDPKDQVKLFAVRSIERLLANPAYHKFMTEGDKLKMSLTSILESGTRLQKLGAMGAMRKANKSLSRTDGIAFLIALLREDDTELKMAALSTLDVILRVTRNPDRRTFCNTSGIPLLAKIIGKGSYSEKMAALQVMDAITIIPPVKAIGLVVQEILEWNGIDALNAVKESSVDVLHQLAAKVESTVEEHKVRNLMNDLLRDVNSIVSVALRGEREEEKTQAAQKLSQLSTWPRAHSAIINAYGVRAIVSLAREGTSEQKLHAVSALKELASNKNHDLIFIDKSVIPVVVDLLLREDHRTREDAFEVLVNLAKRPTPEATDEVQEGLLLVERHFRQGSVADTSAAVRAALMLSRSELMVNSLCSTGCVKALVNALEGSGKQVCERNAAAALFNLSKSSQAREVIASAGGIPKLVLHLSKGNKSSKALAAGAPRYLAQDEENARAIIAEDGATGLIQLARNAEDDHGTNAVRALKRLTGHSSLIPSVVSAGGIAVLVELARTGNPDGLITAATNSLRNIALHSAYRTDVIKAGARKALQTLAKQGSIAVNKAAELALRALLYDESVSVESSQPRRKAQNIQPGTSQSVENKAPEHLNKKQKV